MIDYKWFKENVVHEVKSIGKYHWRATSSLTLWHATESMDEPSEEEMRFASELQTKRMWDEIYGDLDNDLTKLKNLVMGIDDYRSQIAEEARALITEVQLRVQR